MKTSFKIGIVVVFLLIVGTVLAVWRPWSGTSAPAEPVAGEGPVLPVPPVVPEPPPVPKKVYPPSAMDYARLKLTPSSVIVAKSAGAKAGILAAPDARAVLWGQSDDELFPIASVSKLMTLVTALDLVDDSEALTPKTTVTVSKAAMQLGGSQLWLEAGAVYPLDELFAGMMIQSANDASHVVAENLVPGHDVEAYVALMNRHAREIGMRRSRFFNVHGLPNRVNPGQDNEATCLDLVTLGVNVLAHPEAAAYCATRTRDFTHTNGKIIAMTNHNRLLGQCEGVIGLKTGYIDASGYCLVAAATRNGRTLIAVGLGFERRQDRDDFVCALLDWGFAELAAGKVPVSQE